MTNTIEYKQTQELTRCIRTRKELHKFFHSASFRYGLAALIALDLLVVLTDIALMLLQHDGKHAYLKRVTRCLTDVSIGILSVFLVELLSQVFAFSPRKWFRSCLHSFDFSVVLMTLLIEIVAHVIFHEDVAHVAGLAIMFRLWRVIRVVHVTTEALELPHEEEIHDLKAKIKNLEAEFVVFLFLSLFPAAPLQRATH